MVLAKLKGLDKEQKKRTKIITLFALIVIGTLVGGSLLVTVYPTEDYGTIHLYNERTLDEISAGDVLNVQDGDWMVAWLRDDPTNDRKPTDEFFSTKMYLEDGTWIEDGRDRDVYATSYRWWFDLDQCPLGTHTYIIKYFATIEPGVIVKGESFTFQITNAEEPSYDDAAFTEVPDDVGFGVGESPAYVSWMFDYDGPCEGDVTLDGTEVDSQTYPASGTNQIFTYIINTDVAGIFTVVFTLTPDAADNPVISDSVTVTIEGEPPVYADASFTEVPDDVGFVFDESAAYVSWTFDYDGPCAVDVTLDGTEVDSQTYSASDVVQQFDYLVDTSVAGTFTLVFTVTPDAADNPAVSDTAMVTVEDSTTPTTPTTPTPPTTPTTPTTPPDEPDMALIGMVAGIVGGAILIGILLVTGRPKPKGMKRHTTKGRDKL